MLSNDHLTPEALAAAVRDVAAVLDAVIVHRAQVSHLDRDLRAKLSQLVRSLYPPPTDAPPAS